MPAPNPAAEPPPIGSSSQGEPRRASVPPLRLRVLVVDDNRDAADILGGLLGLAGAEVRVAYDAATAAAAFAAFRPDAGLFDLNMPGTDGCALARRAREEAAGRPLLLVAISGEGSPEAIRRTAAAGFDYHRVKPADPRELIATLSRFDLKLRAGDGRA